MISKSPHPVDVENVKPCMERLPSSTWSTVGTTASSPTASIGSRDHPEDLSNWVAATFDNYSLCDCGDGKDAVDDDEDDDDRSNCGEKQLLWRSASSTELRFTRRPSTTSTFILDRENHLSFCRSQSSIDTVSESKDHHLKLSLSNADCQRLASVDGQGLCAGITTLCLVSRDNVGSGHVASSEACAVDHHKAELVSTSEYSYDTTKFDREIAYSNYQQGESRVAGLRCRRSENMSSSVFFSPPLKVGAALGGDAVALCWRGVKQIFRQLSGSRTTQHTTLTKQACDGVQSKGVAQRNSEVTKPPVFDMKNDIPLSALCAMVKASCCSKDDEGVLAHGDKPALMPNCSFNKESGLCMPANCSFFNVNEESQSTVQRMSIAALDDMIWRVARKVYEHVRIGSTMPITLDSEIFREELYALPSRKNIRLRCKTFRQYPSPSNTFVTEVAQTFKAEVCTFSKVFKFIRLHVFKADLSPETLVIALIYIERILNGSAVMLTSTNWRPIVMSSLLVASKLHDDFSSWNVELTVIFPEYTLSSVNRLERALLRALNYSLVVNWWQYAQYYRILQEFGKPPWAQCKVPPALCQEV